MIKSCVDMMVGDVYVISNKCVPLTTITVVFKMHYNELLAKEDEIMRLKAVVEGLSK